MKRLSAMVVLGVTGLVLVARLLAAANEVTEAVIKSTAFWPADPR